LDCRTQLNATAFNCALARVGFDSRKFIAAFRMLCKFNEKPDLRLTFARSHP
jgi:hypothetical protein